MKRTLVAAILGLATVGAAYGQGHLLISNYIAPPYNQVVWTPTGPAVTAADGLTFQIYFGKGVISDPYQLTPGATFHIDDTITTGYDPGAGHGPGGYFLNVDQILPKWVEGDTFTFMYEVITPGYGAMSVLWQENARIWPTDYPPMSAATVPGLVIIPEPCTFALAALGAVSLLISRRRT
jgi:hypothetical protein